MRTILLAALCIAALVTGISRQADADCAAPSIAFAPADGSQVADAVTWVFVPGHLGDIQAEITLRSADGELPAEVVQVSRTESFATYRVAARPVAAGSIDALRYTVDVAVQYHEDWSVRGSASYHLQHQDPASSTTSEPVQLLDPSYQTSRWTCSHTDKITATPSQLAPTYRIEWARSESAYRRGIRSTIVVPWSMDLFWQGSDDQPPAAQIELGHLSCFGETIPAEALARTVYLGIVPLHPGASAPTAPLHPIAVRSGDPLLVEQLGAPEPEPTAPVAEPEESRYICGYAQARMREAREPALPFGVPFGVLFAALGLLVGLGLGGRVSKKLADATVARLDAWSLPQAALVAGVLAALLPIPAVGISMTLWAAAPLGVLGAAVAAIAFRVIRARIR